jgi:hypothetical protein
MEPKHQNNRVYGSANTGTQFIKAFLTSHLNSYASTNQTVPVVFSYCAGFVRQKWFYLIKNGTFFSIALFYSLAEEKSIKCGIQSSNVIRIRIRFDNFAV